MSKAERDRAKAMQEKFQAILSNFLKDEDNKYCVDCDAKGPRWASWNLGIFLCIRCAGIHRKLGVHISKVKSVNLDTWLPDQLAMLQEMGNSRARAVYEANLPDNFRRPQTDSALEAFIRAKYEQKKYIAREWVPPQPKVPKEWVEDDRDKKKNRPKTGSSQIQLGAAPSASRGAASSSSSTASEGRSAPRAPASASTPASAPAPAAAAAPKPAVAAPAPAPSASADLMGLDSTAQAAVPNGGDNLLADIFGGPPAPATANGQAGQTDAQNGGDLFAEGAKGPEKSAKDSIMALFGSGQQQQPQMFGVPGGLYMPQQNMGMFGNMQMPQQGMPQQGMPQQGMPQQGMPQQGMPQQGMPQQGMPQQGMPQQGMAQQGMAQQGMQRMPYMMGMPQQQPAGMYGMGQMPPQMGNMMMQPGNMMYGQQPQQPQQQPMQFQQMQQQMGAMKIGGPEAGSGGWGAPGSGQTLSTNLWQ